MTIFGPKTDRRVDTPSRLAQQGALIYCGGTLRLWKGREEIPFSRKLLLINNSVDLFYRDTVLEFLFFKFCASYISTFIYYAIKYELCTPTHN